MSLVANPVVVGSGPAGCAVATYLGQLGCDVELFEARADLRVGAASEGRSINLALATRGIATLVELNIFDQVEPLLVPMGGRLVHAENGSQNFQPYSDLASEKIFSVSRSGLNKVMLNAAEATGRVRSHFGRRLTVADFEACTLEFTSNAGDVERVPFGTVFGCDGANSAVRTELVAHAASVPTERDVLDHGYKELEIPAKPDGDFALEPNALHIWPRSEFMLIALPNPEGDFTATLFLAHSQFDKLDSQPKIETFFEENFADFVEMVPDFVDQFEENPIGYLGTTRVSKWHHSHKAVLVGDSAHAIVPFHGQGMNLALESARLLMGRLKKVSVTEKVRQSPKAQKIEPADHTGHAEIEKIDETAHAEFGKTDQIEPADQSDQADHLGRTDPADHIEQLRQIEQAFGNFEAARKPGAEAIADMALENYFEMRSKVADPSYLERRELALELEHRFPDLMAARYGMVMFTTMPYDQVKRRALAQNAVIDQLLTSSAENTGVDWVEAKLLLSELGPLPNWA